MLKLKNVSKFYYSNGVVTSGFSKVSLELRKGEFVAITGESGSGKSTLLNVISGLDTYEEGEMYINGEETSAYSPEDFEAYRNKYIANIYQSFNLINSYTVYQNVEMVLLLNKCKRSERRQKVYEVLKKVGLYEFRHARASRLSGGQKQRVAIARALVKDTPIIVADEPTGNLDSEAAANVVALLSELAADRLVIVVTHNYDQVEPYVTRKISMHDGRISEDLVFRAAPEEAEDGESVQLSETNRRDKKGLEFLQRIRLGLRNTFNLIPKFLLLLFIFFFMSTAVTGVFSSLRSMEFTSSIGGYNYYFENTDDERIIIKKADGTAFTEEDYTAIAALDNVDRIYRPDVLLDGYTSVQGSHMVNGEEYYEYFSGSVDNFSALTADGIAYGRLPENENEFVVSIYEGSWMNDEDSIAMAMDCSYDIFDNDGNSIADSRLKLVGVVIVDGDGWGNTIYLSEGLFKVIENNINSNYSTMYTVIEGNKYISERWSMQYKVVSSNNVPSGYAVVSEDLNWVFSKGKAKGKTIEVNVENLYYTDKITLTIKDTYNKRTFTSKTGFDNYDWNNGIIAINSDDYNKLFDKGVFQSSVFVKDVHKADTTVDELKAMGYVTFAMKDCKMSYEDLNILSNMFRKLWYGIIVVALFFICYFIIRLIMKSRNIYYATVRMLGGTAGDCRALIVVELMCVLNLAFIAMLGVIYAGSVGMFQFSFIDDILTYLVTKDYAILYIVLNAMAVLISLRYARQLFKSSAMNAYKEV